MATILVSEILADIIGELNDPNDDWWTESQLIGFINDAMRQLSLVRPDATSVVEVVTLVPGTKQAVPTARRRLLNVIRNMGADGNTPGAVVWPVDRASLDSFNPDWHQDPEAVAIDNFILDEDYPKTYYVTPPVHSTTVVQVEVAFSVNPTLVSASGDTMTVDDVYKGPILHWALYRAYAVETESITSTKRAEEHKIEFYQSLDIKIRVDTGASPSKEGEISV